MLEKSKNRLRFACNVSYFTGVKCGTLVMLTVYSCESCVRFVFVHYFLNSCYAMLALLMWKPYYVRVYSLISMIINQCCCLLYTSDAADERSSVDLGGRRIIK